MTKIDRHIIRRGRATGTFLLVVLAYFVLGSHNRASSQTEKHPLMGQSQAEVNRKDTGCLGCHTGIEPMHVSTAVRLGCVDCHGGNSDVSVPTALLNVPTSPEYDRLKNKAHVLPKFPKRWQDNGKYSAANPKGSYTQLLTESPEFVKFINPGDLRVAQEVCGMCHQEEVNNVRKSTMTTSSVFWAAAPYANGIVSTKYAIFGESYGRDGIPQMLKPLAPLTEEQIKKGALPFLLPLPRWEVTQPGDNFRAFEDGGLTQSSAFPEIGNPNPQDEGGKPDIRLSNRGLGTGLRVSIPLLNMHKTRLNDPHLSFLGTNDHPGDFRSSGCTACHVVYANDRDPQHSGPYAASGHLGQSQSGDKTIPKGVSGHPIRHQLTRAIPSSQCMVCHMHQPNSFINTYYGYNMWDYETDGAFLWPKEQKNPTEKERRKSLDHNPEEAAAKGLWTDPDFLAKVSELNPQLKETQFADYHGHGWVFQATLKRDRKGNLLDKDGKVVPFDDPLRMQKSVHLKDIHLERGMHCVDCHFKTDSHGNGNLVGEYGNAIEIGCEDCHGTTKSKSTLKTSGPAAIEGADNLLLGVTPSEDKRFVWRRGKLIQRSMLDKEKEWIVPQVIDTITPGNPDYNEKAHFAKTIKKGGTATAGGSATAGDTSTAGEIAWGDGTISESLLAHSTTDKMTCYACHSSWMTSCFGCHLPQQANQKSDVQHFEGGSTRQYSSYNPQVVRSDIFMLGINGTNKGNKVSPVRSSSALSLSSVNTNRQRFYTQQPTISAPGFSGQAFNSHIPHTVRGTETKACTDCHLSSENDNNAWMTQLLMLGTNFVNFMGRFAWIAEGKAGISAVGVTEWDEPQAVFGSFLHNLAYPDNWQKHQNKGMKLTEAHGHHAGGEARSLVKRGEYLFAALGSKGFEVFDIANVDNKDFSERIVTAPVSPFGQRTYVRSRYATAVALPVNMPIAPGRKSLPENQEQGIHPIYHYAYFTDREEGLILVNVDTLSDRDPTNNFLKRALTFNPEGKLTGAENLVIAGNTLYIVGQRGLIVIDIADPMNPHILAEMASFIKPTSVTIQFRYAFVTDNEGLKIIDVTHPKSLKEVAQVPIKEAQNVYVARTYAYVAAGKNGVVIVDVENPEKPFIDQTYKNEDSDTRDIKIASTNASLYAYVADGKNGLKVLQLTSPPTTPGYLGFSPRPAPKLIATYLTKGPAQAIAKALDRDRAVDESGNQVAVFNRIGARPFRLDEMQKLYLRNGDLYKVSNKPTTSPSPK